MPFVKEDNVTIKALDAEEGSLVKVRNTSKVQS
jgi:hypothetical protein